MNAYDHAQLSAANEHNNDNIMTLARLVGDRLAALQAEVTIMSEILDKLCDAYGLENTGHPSLQRPGE